jgi:hypothetical protein
MVGLTVGFCVRGYNSAPIYRKGERICNDSDFLDVKNSSGCTLPTLPLNSQSTEYYHYHLYSPKPILFSR